MSNAMASENNVVAGLRFTVQEITGYCGNKTARLVSEAVVVNTFSTENPKKKENGEPQADLQWASVRFPQDPHRTPAVYPVAQVQEWHNSPLPPTPR